ncbi:hypothetical protein C8J57DRAFT_1043857 [Mycena rebaudengoi]|nr:hypothetical protein C8J57DRAFT_1043857 [Mycena rebaudengoi]
MGPSASLVERSNADASDLLLLGTPMESLFMFNMIVGDSVVIWRVWVLYPKKRWVVAIPCLVLLMSFIFTIIDITCLTGAGWSDRSAVAAGGELCSRSELLAWAFSLVTNASCTVLIGIKAWHHRKKMRALSGQRTTTERMLSLLVESGFIYCLFWLTQLVLFFDIPRSSPLIYVYFLFSGMGDQISGMYPTLIIVIVNLHRTVWEPPSTAGGTTSTIRLSTGRPTISTGTTQGDFDSGFELELGKSRNAV